MTKAWTPKRETVELRPSRIRRQTPAAATAKPDKLRTPSGERDTRTVVIGVFLFALAFVIILVGFSDFTSK